MDLLQIIRIHMNHHITQIHASNNMWCVPESFELLIYFYFENICISSEYFKGKHSDYESKHKYIKRNSAEAEENWHQFIVKL